MFWGIRPYKGIEIAIESVNSLGDDYQLIIAGKPLNQAYGESLEKMASGMDNVVLLYDYINNEFLADLILAADCVLLPYRQITGSGALLTCLTLGRGVVASDLPFFRDLLTPFPNAGVLATPGDVKQFKRAIEMFFDQTMEVRSFAAKQLADGYDWNVVISPVVDWLVKTFPDKIVLNP